ncbi:DUF6702 family protein [Flavobacterium inviolabile]|uniref:DUF6702 family protein n=1 Tax=Flavobacterium inviolabile TaxID=2748320 RepID=UPI0015A83C88|nr:DUF6702 family protein [Flavobacterium inviolabile]
MIKMLRYGLLIVLFTGLSAMSLHKFYVSIFQMNYVPEKKTMQITARIFTDDLEKALEKKSKKKIYLATPKEAPETEELLKKYLAEKVRIKINNTEKTIRFLGRETEDDVEICYLTVPVSEKINTLEVYNTVLTEIFPDQQNIIHTSVNSNKKSLLLTNSKPKELIEY